MQSCVPRGMVPAPDGTWVYYDYVPEEHDIRSGKPEVTGKICVIGSKLDEDKLWQNCSVNKLPGTDFTGSRIRKRKV